MLIFGNLCFSFCHLSCTPLVKLNISVTSFHFRLQQKEIFENLVSGHEKMNHERIAPYLRISQTNCIKMMKCCHTFLVENQKTVFEHSDSLKKVLCFSSLSFSTFLTSDLHRKVKINCDNSASLIRIINVFEFTPHNKGWV